MKISLSHHDGSVEIVDLIGPLRVIEHPAGTMNILHDEGTGWDYWFLKSDGSFDGTGMSAQDLTVEEAKGIAQGLKDMAANRTRSLEDIKKELKRHN